MYKVKIDSKNYLEEVEGTLDWSRSVTRDFTERIFRTKGNYSFTGYDGLYNLLYNELSINGVCTSLTARIYFNNDYEWRGEVKPQDFEFDILNRGANGQILDNAWASKFNNSQDQRVFLRSERSINDLFIGECESRLCTFFDVSTGSYDFDNIRCFRLLDVFTFLVKYLSDDTVSFVSDFFDTGDGKQFYLTTGKEIRLQDDSANPEISFSALFDEANKKFNLWIIIEGTQDAPILRIEPYEYLFTGTKLTDVVDPQELKVTTELDQLYTLINVGSSATEYDVDNNAEYPDVLFKAWNNESYNTDGGCQFENNVLDLVSTWKIDTNSVQQSLSGVESHDSSIFMVEIDSASNNAFQYTTEFTNGDNAAYVYNFNLNNENVINNWFDGIPQEMSKFLTKEYRCYVGLTAGYEVDSPTVLPDDYAYEEIQYDDDQTGTFSDPDSLYTTASEASGDDTAGEFKAPVGGVYRFQAELRTSNPPVDKSVGIAISIFTDNTRSRRLAWYRGRRKQLLTGGSSTSTFDELIYMNADEVAVVHSYEFRQVVSGDNGYQVGDSTCSMTAVTYDYNSVPSDPLIYKYEIGENEIGEAQFNAIDQGLGFVRIIDTKNNTRYDVYATNAQYNRTTGTLEVGEFIGRKPPVELCWILNDGKWNDDCYWLDNEKWID